MVVYNTYNLSLRIWDGFLELGSSRVTYMSFRSSSTKPGYMPFRKSCDTLNLFLEVLPNLDRSVTHITFPSRCDQDACKLTRSSTHMTLPPGCG